MWITLHFFLACAKPESTAQLVGAPFWCCFHCNTKPRRFQLVYEETFWRASKPIFIPVCFWRRVFPAFKRPIQRSLWSKPPAQNFARISYAGRNSPSPSINIIICICKKANAIRRMLMPDMLVKLYKVKEDPALEARLAANGIQLKRALAPDIQRITGFV